MSDETSGRSILAKAEPSIMRARALEYAQQEMGGLEWVGGRLEAADVESALVEAYTAGYVKACEDAERAFRAVMAMPKIEVA